MGMGSQRALLAGLMGLFGGFGGQKLPSLDPPVPRPTVDDVWAKLSKKKSKMRLNKYALSRAEKRKRKWAIEKASRKKNYQRNGTRG